MRGKRILFATVLAGSVGCSTLQPLDPALIAVENPKLVYVTHKNRSLMTIAEPRVSGDSLYGYWAGVGRPMAVPLSVIERVEVLRRDQRRTTLAIVGLTALTVVGVWAVVQVASGSETCDYGDPDNRCPDP
jgi:hypothetical protein